VYLGLHNMLNEIKKQDKGVFIQKSNFHHRHLRCGGNDEMC